MNNNPISPDDPRLTSYALNEMAPDERVAFERALAQDATAQLAVEQIRRTSDQLIAALQHEADTSEDLTPPATATQAPAARIIRFPYWMVSSLAAACFAVAFIYWQREQLPSAVVDSSTAPVGAAVASKDEAKSIAADGKASVASRNMMVVAGAPLSVAQAPQPAPVELATPSPAHDQAELSRLRAEEFRATGQTAKTSGEAMEKQQAVQAEAALARKSASAKQPLAEVEPLGNEADSNQREPGFLAAGQHPLSTFSVDVDTTSYANVRRFLLQGLRPPVDAVRIEEMVNYFPYHYAGPKTNDPIAASLEVASAPWAPAHRLVRIGLQGQDMKRSDREVKIQVEFNPREVQAYRLLGYEDRLLAKADCNHEQVDTGELGAEHTVTALYEVVPTGAEMPTETPPVEALDYQVAANPASRIQTPKSGELLTVRIRFKDAAGRQSRKLEFPLRDSGHDFAAASQDFKFAAAVAAFGMVLRESPHQGASTPRAIILWARDGLGNDAGGYRNEFIELVERAQRIMP